MVSIYCFHSQKNSDRQVDLSRAHGFYTVENPLTPTRAKGIFPSEWKRKSNQSDGRQNIQPPPSLPTPMKLIYNLHHFGSCTVVRTSHSSLTLLKENERSD